MSDEEVLVRIRQGEESALAYLYKKYYKMMVNMIIKNNGSEEEAKDIFQDALVVFWQKASSNNLVLTSKISTYLYSICQNLWRKELDRKGKLSYEDHDRAEKPDYDNQEKIMLVQKCLQEMGDTCRKILTYYYYDELSMNDIAEKLGFANADTAKTKKYKCKKELDELIKFKYTKLDFLD